MYATLWSSSVETLTLQLWTMSSPRSIADTALLVVKDVVSGIN